jgi:CO dehydrogenase maturation factor
MTILSVSGKGGAGKTVLTALMLKVLLNRGKSNILVVDADPSTNLPETLGVEVERTVGDVVNVEFKGKVERDELPPEVDKKAFLEGLILQTLAEQPSFDLLAMGRLEGEGCYCLVNHLLTDIIDRLSGGYELVLMDMEAGLEHVSRRTDRDADIMLIVTDPSKMGFQAAMRIHEIAQKVHIKFRRMCLVGNMFPDDESLRLQLNTLGMEVVGIVPSDPNVASFNLQGKPLLDLPDDSPAVLAVEQIVDRLNLA